MSRRRRNNQRYTSEAIVPDGSPDPGCARDPELHHQPSSRPGAKLPHAWITSGTRTLSTLDTVGKGRFTLLTGIGGEAWLRAAHARSLDIAPVVVDPGQEHEDPYGDRAALSGISDAGALLVRPDGCVAFRHADATAEAEPLLTDALRRVLGHG